MTPRFFSTPQAFRRWLQTNHDRIQELWVGFHKRHTGRASITWPEAVDQALCFGWIDGLRKSIDDESYMIRFTPRKARSIWSAVNLRRFDVLVEQGVVHAAGLRAHARRDENRTNRYSFENRDKELDPRYRKQFRSNRAAWEFFTSQAPWYQRTASWWVISARKEETRLRRLKILIDCSEKGKRIPQVLSKK